MILEAWVLKPYCSYFSNNIFCEFLKFKFVGIMIIELIKKFQTV